MKTVRRNPSLIVPPKSPGLCSGMSITFNKTNPALPSPKDVIPHILCFISRGTLVEKIFP